MAPKRLTPAATKRPSHPPSTVSPNGSPNQATTAKMHMRSPVKSPMKKGGTTMITQAQKQALIDNLQLEVTERARKLRAQYALQAQGLRTRLEIRVHRIPAALRKATVKELMERFARAGTGQKEMGGAGIDAQKSPVRSPAKAISPTKLGLPQPQSPTKMGEKLRREVVQQQREQQGQGKRGVKRKSDAIDTSTNHENTTTQNTNTDPAHRLASKRAKPSTITTNAPTSTVPSPGKRTIHSSSTTTNAENTTREVLSPKSSNMQSQHRTNSHALSPEKSPFKASNMQSGTSPSKFGFIYTSPSKRPISPIKPSITAPTATSTAKTRTASAKATGARAVSKTKPTGTGTRSKAMAPPPRVVEEPDAEERMIGAGGEAQGNGDNDGGERESNISTADSSTSAGTTIIKKSAAAATTTRGGTVRGAAGRTASKATAAPNATTAAKANTATSRAASKTTTAEGRAEGRGTGTIPRGTTAAAKKALSAKSEAVNAANTATGGLIKGGRTLRKRGA